MSIDVGLDNSGSWDTLQDGSKVWRLRIESLDARERDVLERMLVP